MDGVLVLLFIVPVFISTDPERCVTRGEYVHLEHRLDAIENMQQNTGEAGLASFAATLTTSVQLKENATIVFDNFLLNTAEAYNSYGVFTALFNGIHFFSATMRTDHSTALTTGIVKMAGLWAELCPSVMDRGQQESPSISTPGPECGCRWIRMDHGISGPNRGGIDLRSGSQRGGS